MSIWLKRDFCYEEKQGLEKDKINFASNKTMQIV